MIGRFFAVGLLTLAVAAPVSADDTPEAVALESQLRGKTIIYTDAKSGEEHSVYFGRFGNFDRYVPCDFTDGYWKVTENGNLCLKDREGDEAEMCFKPTVTKQSVSWKEPDSIVTNVARLLVGNKLPIG